MGKISHSSIQRTQIVTLHREGYSEHEISVQTGKLNFTIPLPSTKLMTYSDPKISEHPRKTTLKDDHIIQSIIE